MSVGFCAAPEGISQAIECVCVFMGIEAVSWQSKQMYACHSLIRHICHCHDETVCLRKPLRDFQRDIWVTLVLLSAICALSFGIWQVYIQQEVTNMHYMYLGNLSPLHVMRNACKFLDIVHFRFSWLADPLIDPSLQLTYLVTKSRLSRFALALAERLSFADLLPLGSKWGAMLDRVLLKSGMDRLAGEAFWILLPPLQKLCHVLSPPLAWLLTPIDGLWPGTVHRAAERPPDTWIKDTGVQINGHVCQYFNKNTINAFHLVNNKINFCNL